MEIVEVAVKVSENIVAIIYYCLGSIKYGIELLHGHAGRRGGIDGVQSTNAVQREFDAMNQDDVSVEDAIELPQPPASMSYAEFLQRKKIDFLFADGAKEKVWKRREGKNA